MFISRESELSNVDDVFNGILVRWDATGDVVFYGKGAGKLPTASAVVADVIDCVKHFKARKYLFWEDGKPDYVEPFASIPGDFFVHVKGQGDSAEAFALAESVFPGAVRMIRRDESLGEAGFAVKAISISGLEEKLAELEGRGAKVLNHIKISDF